MGTKANIGIIKNYIYNLSYQILAIIVPLITTPYVSRILHADGIGIYSYTGTITTFFSLFAALGVNSYGQREIAYFQNEKKKRSIVFWELFLCRVVTTLVVCIIYFLFAVFSGKYSNYYFIQIFTLLSVMVDISWFFQGIENFKVVAIRNVLIRIVTVFLVFIFVKNENDLDKYMWINSLSTFFSCLFMIISLKGEVYKISISVLKPLRHMRGILEFFLPVLAVQLYSQVDKVMLGMITDNTTQNGYYEQARKITELVVKVVVSLNTVLFSRVAFLVVQKNDQKIKNILKKSFNIIIMMLAPMMVGLYCISDNFVLWFFGLEYKEVAILIKLSCPLILFMCIGNFVGVQFLNPTRQQNKATIIYFISALINIVLNMVLIPCFFSVGAMVASNIAECISCILQVYILKKSKYNFQMSKGIFQYIFASFIMGIVILFLNTMNFNSYIVKTIVEIVVGVCIYMFVLFCIKERNITYYIDKRRNK